MKSRITRMTAALLAAVLSLGLLVGCKPKKEPTRYSTIFYDVFDTVTQVIAYCESEEAFNTQMQALHQDLIAYNQLYDMIFNYFINNLIIHIFCCFFCKHAIFKI